MEDEWPSLSLKYGICRDCLMKELPNERKVDTSFTLRFDKKDAYMLEKEKKMEEDTKKETKWERTLKSNFKEIYIIEDRIKASIGSAIRSLYPSCYPPSKNDEPIIGLEQFYDGKFSVSLDASFKIDREDVK
jgi:hypothetical protein